MNADRSEDVAGKQFLYTSIKRKSEIDRKNNE